MDPTSRANAEELDCSRLIELIGGDWTLPSGPLYRRLADRIDELIAGSELRNHVQLPAERAVAEALGVSRSTVVSALDVLRERGSVVSRQGSGTRVTGPPPPNTQSADFRSRSLFVTGPELIELNIAVPDLLPSVRRSYDEFSGSHASLDLSVAPEGVPVLREAIAERYAADGLPTRPEDILVTSGAQQAISLGLSVLCRPGDVVLCEAHTWPGMTDSVGRLGARCYGVTTDHQGIDTTELRSAIERLRPAVIALNPHHQNPTATRLVQHRRCEVAQISADYGVPVLEDRVSALLAFDGVTPRPLAAERPDAPILTADSISKVAWPGVRLGWIRVSQGVMSELRLAKAINDMFTSPLSQAFGLHLLTDLDGIAVERSAQLATRATLAVDLLHELLAEWEVTEPPGGMVLWPRLPLPVAPQLVHHAARCGVSISGAGPFAVGKPAEDRIRIPFTQSEADLTEGIHRLANAWRTLEPTDHTPPPSDALII